MKEAILALSLGRFTSLADLNQHLETFPKPPSKHANRVAKIVGNRWVVGYYPPASFEREQKYNAVPIDDDGRRLVVYYDERKILLWYRKKLGDPFYAYEFLEGGSEKPEEDIWI